MRRITTSVGFMAAAAMIGMAIPGSAFAATGTLKVGFQSYQDPQGCYTSNAWPMRVGNYTDQPAFVYDGENCTGRVVAVVAPGNTQLFEFGNSVYIK